MIVNRRPAVSQEDRLSARMKVAQCATCRIEPDAVRKLAGVAGLLGVPAATLQRFHEPYLMRLGLIAIVRGGRVAA